jgi:DNA polymerase V
MNVVALVDCNSFYASCEAIFKPQLKNQPVVVLSNNDGCVIARSSLAKKLGLRWEFLFLKLKN